MKMNKITILMIAVVAIGIFALPSTLSVGDGQHKFRQAGSTQTNLTTFCAQCHAVGGDSISNELDTSDTRLNDNLGYGNENSRIHATVDCEDCHAITEGYGLSNQSTQHAASLPSCKKCHDGNTTAVSYGNANNVTEELVEPTEAHKAVYLATQASGKDDDIMCIGCHTYVVKGGQVTYAFTAGVNVYGLTIGATPTVLNIPR